jgi:hypothetical protein
MLVCSEGKLHYLTALLCEVTTHGFSPLQSTIDLEDFGDLIQLIYVL